MSDADHDDESRLVLVSNLGFAAASGGGASTDLGVGAGGREGIAWDAMVGGGNGPNDAATAACDCHDCFVG